MAAETRSTLAGYFVAGAEPTAAQFETLIYSVANVRDVNRFTSSLHNTGSVHFQSTLDVVGAATITGSLKLSSTFSGNRREIELVTADEVDMVFIAHVGKSSLRATWDAVKAGKKIAEMASKAGIANVVFDRNGYLYHGRVKALAESAREGGLKF